MKSIAEPPPLSATAIARKLGRSPQAVMNAIKRLGIQPSVSVASGKYYPEDTTAAVERAMRRPNGATSKQG